MESLRMVGERWIELLFGLVLEQCVGYSDVSIGAPVPLHLSGIVLLDQFRTGGEFGWL